MDEPPFEPARLRFAAVLAAFALVRAVLAADFAPRAADFAPLRADFVARFAPLEDERFFDPPLDLREPPLDLRELLLDLRELLLELDELRDFDAELRLRPPPVLRSAAGISSRATLFASFGISFSRNFAMRSSSRRICFAT